jgi:hypothetical protein
VAASTLVHETQQAVALDGLFEGRVEGGQSATFS